MNPVAFRRAILAWYDAHARALPWRVGPADHATGLRAQIAALEWAQGQLHMGLAINAEIERLRKELEG